jgi:hypothetical protein
MSVTHITLDGKKYDRRAQYDAFFVVSDWDAGTQAYLWGGVAKLRGWALRTRRFQPIAWSYTNC